jgi:hypothetical protein
MAGGGITSMLQHRVQQFLQQLCMCSAALLQQWVQQF